MTVLTVVNLYVKYEVLHRVKASKSQVKVNVFTQ